MSLLTDIWKADQQRKTINSGLDAQRDATDKQIALQERMYDTTRADNMPAMQARNQSLEMLLGMLKPGGSMSRLDVGDVTQEPGYQFGMQQGQSALNNQLGARGMRNSGAALKAAARYGTDYGTTKYNDAFNRLLAGRSAQMNPLLSLAGAGQVGASTIASAGNNYANVAGNALSQFGDARANAALAKGSIYPKMINQWEGRAMNALSGGFGG